MSRVNNLFDLHKNRIARISDDYTELIVLYELRKPTGLQKSIAKNKLKSKFLDCEIEIYYEKNELIIKIKQKQPDLNKVYHIFLVIAYLLGNEITLFRIFENFPYYHIPRYFNFGGYPFCFVNNKRLILETKKVIEDGYKLLHKEGSVFSKLVPFLLDINTISSSEVRFFAEFSLLEFLASELDGIIFSSQKKQKILRQFSKKAADFVKEELNNFEEINNDELRNKIKDSFSTNLLNRRYAKNAITTYIEGFSSENLKSYSQYVKNWNALRNKKGLAHGNILKIKSKRDEKDGLLEDKLHEFLSTIVFEEFSEFSR